jgi:hypothetical protein
VLAVDDQPVPVDVEDPQTVPLPGSGAPVTLLEPASDFVNDPEVWTTWLPDGTALALANGSGYYGNKGSRIYIVKADGSGLSAVPGIEDALDPAWRPE